jgi:cardiolipin synthase
VQFYQILPDRVGRRFFFQLRRKAREGVRVYVMYDAMGSYKLRRDILDAVRSSGIKIVNFLAMHPLKRRYQINWRNHRKILVCDGEVAFVGGFNIGETYLEGDHQGNPLWKDAHFRVKGSCVDAIQQVFAGDWLFATGEKIDFATGRSPEDSHRYAERSSQNFVAVIPSGPSDHRALMHSTLSAILHGAETRVWITTAYFVPDRQIMEAMRQAVERGVDVRVVIPKRSNHPITDFCSTSYFAEFLDLGIRVYLYKPGMCHAKLLLADDDLVLSGSSNLDYRSFFLNFELDLLIRDRRLAPDVEKFLTESFQQSETLGLQQVRPRNLPLKAARNLIRLFAPLM